MRFSVAFIALAVAPLILAAPVRHHIADSEILVVTFADVLEQLEAQFYTEALNKFNDQDFQTAGFSIPQVPLEQFKNIQRDEKAHLTALRGILKTFKKSPIDTCKFNFDAALKDVATMAATARVVEDVGVGAYLGGTTLITDPVLLTAAGSILTVEARHQTVLNILNNGTAIPSAFDIPLTPPEVLALAGPFISGCDLGIPSNTPLSITNQGAPVPGTKLEFQAATLNGTQQEEQLFCQMLLGGQAESIALPFNQCVVPNDINGPVAIWITGSSKPLPGNVRDRPKVKTIAGPALAFIDTKPEALGSVARSGSAAQGGSSDAEFSASDSASTTTSSPPSSTTYVLETTTVSPADAMRIVNDASSAQSSGYGQTTAAYAEPTQSGPGQYGDKSSD